MDFFWKDDLPQKVGPIQTTTKTEDVLLPENRPVHSPTALQRDAPPEMFE